MVASNQGGWVHLGECDVSSSIKELQGGVWSCVPAAVVVTHVTVVVTHVTQQQRWLQTVTHVYLG